MSNVNIQIVAQEAAEACKDTPDLKERVRKAMQKAYKHWMVLDEQEQFKGAVTGAFLCSDEDDKLTIKAALQSLQTLSAVLSGVPVDLEEALKQQESVADKLALLPLWKEVKAEMEAKK